MLTILGDMENKIKEMQSVKIQAAGSRKTKGTRRKNKKHK
jgi:hypothetical protein